MAYYPEMQRKREEKERAEKCRKRKDPAKWASDEFRERSGVIIQNLINYRLTVGDTVKKLDEVRLELQKEQSEIETRLKKLGKGMSRASYLLGYGE